jgi:hypothetical protein
VGWAAEVAEEAPVVAEAAEAQGEAPAEAAGVAEAGVAEAGAAEAEAAGAEAGVAEGASSDPRTGSCLM